VCPNRELWPDRFTYEHPAWSKTCSVHARRQKKHIQKFNQLPPYFGVKWGVVWKNVGENMLVFENISCMPGIEIQSSPLSSPDIET
jgi:hypothetical protein